MGSEGNLIIAVYRWLLYMSYVPPVEPKVTWIYNLQFNYNSNYQCDGQNNSRSSSQNSW